MNRIPPYIARAREIQQQVGESREKFAAVFQDIYAGTTNFQEELVPAYDIPSPLTGADGKRVCTAVQWMNFRRREVLELNLKVPSDQEYPERWGEPFLYETFPNFHIYDESGAEVNYQLGKVRRNTQSRFYRADVRLKDVIPVTLETELRASGWTTLTVVPEKKRPRCFLSQLAGLRSAENKFLRLTVNADGSLDIFDKRTSRNYPDCHTFLIDREIGDGWNHIRPAGFPELRQGVSVKSIAVTTDGPARTTFEIIREMELPAELEFKGTLTEHYAGIEESRDTVTLKIKSLVSLDADSPYVKITTELNNTLRDYRLRMVLPTSIPGKYFAYQNFTFLQREPGRATGRLTEGYWEAEPLEKNFSGIAGKRDADGGIALVSRYGLHELSASEFSSGELFFTLLRAFRRTIFTDGEPEGQLPGVLKFEYSLCPLAATDDNAALYRYSLEYRSQAPSYMLPESVAAEPESWFTLDGDLSLSALKPAQNMAEKQAILRLINYHGESAEGKLKFSTPVRLSEVNLDESEIMVEPLEGTEFIVSARPDQLKTYRIEF